MDAIAEIKKIYYAATKATIHNDLVRAIDLLKTLPSEEDRQRVAVYMDGLSQMRSEWSQAAQGGVTSNSNSRVSSPRDGARRGRSGRPRSS